MRTHQYLQFQHLRLQHSISSFTLSFFRVKSNCHFPYKILQISSILECTKSCRIADACLCKIRICVDFLFLTWDHILIWLKNCELKWLGLVLFPLPLLWVFLFILNESTVICFCFYIPNVGVFLSLWILFDFFCVYETLACFQKVESVQKRYIQRNFTSLPTQFLLLGLILFIL